LCEEIAVKRKTLERLRSDDAAVQAQVQAALAKVAGNLAEMNLPQKG